MLRFIVTVGRKLLVFVAMAVLLISVLMRAELLRHDYHGDLTATLIGGWLGFLAGCMQIAIWLAPIAALYEACISLRRLIDT